MTEKNLIPLVIPNPSSLWCLLSCLSTITGAGGWEPGSPWTHTKIFLCFSFLLLSAFPKISTEGEEWEAPCPAPPLHLGMPFPKPNLVARASTQLWIIPAQIVGLAQWGKPNNGCALIFN